MNGVTDELVMERGPHSDERVSPCSTFKIVLSLMGYDAGILKDESAPTWDYREGYDDYLETWKTPLTPQAWMNFSCVWYSKILALQLGVEQMQSYLTSFDYGNSDMSGGLAEPGPLDPAWINSSIKISPEEQMAFIQRMVRGKLPIASSAVQLTKKLLFKEMLAEGWSLYGKTGFTGALLGLDGQPVERGWFVGWIEKDDSFFPFAYLICDQKIDLTQRIPRVKQLLEDSNAMRNILRN